MNLFVGPSDWISELDRAWIARACELDRAELYRIDPRALRRLLAAEQALVKLGAELALFSELSMAVREWREAVQRAEGVLNEN